MSAYSRRTAVVALTLFAPLIACGEPEPETTPDEPPEAVAAAEEPAAPAPSGEAGEASALNVTFGATDDGRSLQILPSYSLEDGSGSHCVVTRFTADRGFESEVRRGFDAGSGVPTVTFDPEADETFLARSENQGEFRYDVTTLVYDDPCGQVPDDGGGEPLARWEGEACFSRTITGDWSMCPIA